MERKQLAKSHGILCSVMEFCQFCSHIVPNLYLFGHHKELKQRSKKSAFSEVFGKMSRRMVMENQEMVMEKSWKSHGKYFVKSVGTLFVLIL